MSTVVIHETANGYRDLLQKMEASVGTLFEYTAVGAFGGTEDSKTELDMAFMVLFRRNDNDCPIQRGAIFLNRREAQQLYSKLGTLLKEKNIDAAIAAHAKD